MKKNLCVLSFLLSAEFTVAMQMLTKSVCHLLTANKGLFYVTVNLCLISVIGWEEEAASPVSSAIIESINCVFIF